MNQPLLNGDAAIIIERDNIFISSEFNKFKKYINYEEITLNDDLIKIEEWVI